MGTAAAVYPSPMSEMMRRTREIREQQERDLLAPAATLSTKSRGRQHHEEPDPYRTAFERDRDRILHTKAFRRLKHKTQVFINPEGDHYVTRLTHTLQVTQVGRAMASDLGLNEPLTEAICLAHDVGHSPFGHTGEDALSPYDGIRAHSWKIDPPPSTPEGMLCRFADRIAYLTHDVDDALRASVIRRSDLPEQALLVFGEPGAQWIDTMINAVVDESLGQGRVEMAPDVLDAMQVLRDFMFDRVYLRPESRPQQLRAIAVIRDLVDHFIDHPDEVPDSYRVDDADDVERAIDYVSGMTDRYALRMHDGLFRPEGID
jgi:dGTPase